MPQILLADRIGMIDLVPENTERDLAQLFHCQKGVELGLRFGEALVVFGVDQEDDPGDFGEVIFP